MSHSTEHNSRPEQSATLFIAASERANHEHGNLCYLRSYAL